jgi:rhomboid family protein
MICPTCGAGLKRFKYRGLVVDTCCGCQGIWFDPGEMMEYIEFLLDDDADIPEAKIDLGSEVITEREISESTRTCPHCNATMQKLNYAYDSNIILDKCSICEGLWADGPEIEKLATYIKGNPKLDRMGNAIIEEKNKFQRFTDMVELCRSSSSRGKFMAYVYLPKIVLPLGDDVKNRTIPGVVITILLLNVMMFIFQPHGFENLYSFFSAFGLVPASVLSGTGYSTFITSMFLHGGIIHLFGNMFFFWIFGDNIEDSLGHLRFLIFYIAVGVLAGAVHVLTNMQSDIPVIGASGAVSGVMGAYIVMYPHAKVKVFFICQIVELPAYVYLGGWIALQILSALLFMSLETASGIAWFAHIGGFLSGAILMWLYKIAGRPL